jgi:dipeptidyl aminopeptidase/acylaminoacyl peptidase
MAATTAADGTILECAAPVLPSYNDVITQAEPFVAEEHERSALSAEFARQPLASIFTSEEYRRLEGATTAERCLQIIYVSGGARVCGYVVLPSSEASPRGTILFARGGSRYYGAISPLTLLDLLALADAGYVVVATQYRGGPGSEGRDQFGGEDVDDLLNLVAVGRSFYDADPVKFFLWGVSRGGMMAALALKEGLDVRAAALRAPMVDLAETASLRPEMRANFEELMPDWAVDPAAALARRSALCWPEELHVPILLLHGRQDWRVPVSQSERLAAALRDAGRRDIALIVYERDTHLLLLHRRPYLDAIRSCFDQHGGKGAATGETTIL